MAGLIAMVSALTVVGIEMFMRTRGVGHSHSHGEAWDKVPGDEHEDGPLHGSNGDVLVRPGTHRHGKLSPSRTPKDITLGDLESSGLVANASPYPDSSRPETGYPLNHKQINDDEDSDLDLDELDHSSAQPSQEATIAAATLTPREETQKKLLQCLLLEAGILFHSIFIGMAISVATGTPFIVFLIAIAFHQSFEGIALGTRIAAINFPRSSPRPWLMVLAYGTTTPIGQAIGLGVHSMYDPMSETGLLMVGIMNGISSGLLLFAGLVQLLSEDFLTDRSYQVLRGTRRWRAYGAVIGGAFLMALVGAWA